MGRNNKAAYRFWLESWESFKRMGSVRSLADPCLHFRWTEHGLSLWMTHVDDNMVTVLGTSSVVADAKRSLQHVGPLEEYLGCKIDYNRDHGKMKITQPVLLQSFIDEFYLPAGPSPRTPAVPHSVLLPSTQPPDLLLDDKEAALFRRGTCKQEAPLLIAFDNGNSVCRS